MANTTWDPNDLVSVTLSGGNLTATATSTTSWIRAVDKQTTGKYYFELKPTTWTNGSTQVGISNVGGFPSAGHNAVVILSGAIFINGSNSGSSLGARSAGDVIGVAVDCGTNSIWFRVAPAGNWNGSGTANPATPLGGLSVSAIAANGMSPAGLFFASGDAVTANFGDSAFVGGVPSGFTSGFPAQVLAHATWNPSDKTSSVTLSGGSLTATLVNGTQGVRSTKAMTSGKAYFEISASTWAGAGSPPVGIANTTAALSSMSSSGSVGAATVIPAGNIYVNGSVTGVSIGARADGDVIGIAADLTNSLIWFRVAPAGNWNGNATYAPGVAGGVSFSAITGATICPVAAVQLSIQCVFTGNFGDSAFSGTVPSGYTAGWPPAPTVLNGPIVTMIG